jgi:uncharacterized protein YggU (UPF0235/DUF167 family)
MGSSSGGTSNEGSPFHRSPRGLRVQIRLTPKAKADRIQGLVAEADGATALKVQVTAAPEDGRANKALIALLAASWQLPKSSMTLVAGATDRRKLLELAGEPEALLARLQSWCDGLGSLRGSA